MPQVSLCPIQRSLDEIHHASVILSVEMDEQKDRIKELEKENRELLKKHHEQSTELEKMKEKYFELKYDRDEWAWGYGSTIKDGEYSVCMAGGGDHWENYVINKNGCFIENTHGRKKVFTFISCPEGNYTKVISTPHEDGGITLDEGEFDIFEMVKESYVDEIMNYEESESEEEEEEEVQGSKVDMEAFNKLKEGGMMPWVK